MSLTIRPTESADLPALLDIYNYEVQNGFATFDLNPKSLDDWQSWFKAHSVGNHFAVTALLGGVPVGYASLSGYREKEAYIIARQCDIISKIYHPFHKERISLKKVTFVGRQK